MRRLLVVAGLTALIVVGLIASLALTLAIAWDEVPPPPEPSTSWSAQAARGFAETNHPGNPSGGPGGLLLVATTLEGRLT